MSFVNRVLASLIFSCFMYSSLYSEPEGLSSNLQFANCCNPCQPQNYNGLAFSFMPAEFYFPPCDRPTGADINLKFCATVGESIATNKSYITVDLNARQFYTFYELYFDAKWHYLSNWKNAANAGLGIRTFDCFSIVGGANIYFDYIRGPWHKDFYQISGGLEIFHPCFNVYINGYYPLCGHKKGKTKIFCYDNGYFASCSRDLFALGGLDIEIDKTMFYVCGSRINFGAGIYFYDNSGKHGWFTGGRLRICADITTNIRLNLEGTYDDVHCTKLNGTLSVNFPFPVWGYARKGSKCCETWCPPLPQHRNNLIVLRKHEELVSRAAIFSLWAFPLICGLRSPPEKWQMSNSGDRSESDSLHMSACKFIIRP